MYCNNSTTPRKLQFSSFVRQLNMYGFCKVHEISPENVYRHASFRENAPELLPEVKRRYGGGKQTRPSRPIRPIRPCKKTLPQFTLNELQERPDSLSKPVNSAAVKPLAAFPAPPPKGLKRSISWAVDIASQLRRAINRFEAKENNSLETKRLKAERCPKQHNFDETTTTPFSFYDAMLGKQGIETSATYTLGDLGNSDMLSYIAKDDDWWEKIICVEEDAKLTASFDFDTVFLF